MTQWRIFRWFLCQIRDSVSLMLILPIHTPLLHAGDDLSTFLTNRGDIRAGDIVVISSKAVATTEGAAMNLSLLHPTKEAKEWATQCGKTPEFRQAVLDETKRMRGLVIASCPQAMLTELTPPGLTAGTILAINAGLDESNIAEGFAIGWPKDPVKSVRKLREDIEEKIGSQIGVILSDSCCRPRRIGVTAMALTVSGMDPLMNMVGQRDLFDKELRMTIEARADQLATAANFLMGNAAQSIPAVIIRDHGLPLSDFNGWVSGIAMEADIFRGMFS